MMGLMGKKKLDEGWVGVVSSIHFCVDFLEFFCFAKPLILQGV